MSDWIKVEDREPWENISVLTYNANGDSADEREPEIGYFERGHWYWVDRTNFDHYDVLHPTHWMPLPAKPQENSPINDLSQVIADAIAANGCLANNEDLLRVTGVIRKVLTGSSSIKEYTPGQ